MSKNNNNINISESAKTRHSLVLKILLGIIAFNEVKITQEIGGCLASECATINQILHNLYLSKIDLILPPLKTQSGDEALGNCRSFHHGPGGLLVSKQFQLS